MSALNEIKGKSNHELTYIEYLIVENENRETTSTIEGAANEYAALRAERNEAVRLLAKSGIPYEAIRMDYGSKKWIAESVWNLIEETTNEIRAFLSKIEERK